MSDAVLWYALDGNLCLGEFHSHIGDQLLEPLRGRSILGIVSDPVLQELLGALFRAVLDSGREVRVKYRCDTPKLRRHCTLRVTRRGLGPAAGLVVENFVDTFEPRPNLELLETSRDFGRGAVTVCSWCKKVQDPNGLWFEIDEGLHRLDVLGRFPLPRITHGMCPACCAELGAAASPGRAPHS